MLDPQVPFRRSVEVTLPGLWLRSLAGMVLTAGHLVFAWHWWRMVRGREPAREIPQFHEARPVLYVPEVAETTR
jgi:cytochrome c oxidase cbb3-type subunit 1